MINDLCSVTIRTINRPLMLKEAIESVLIQDYCDIELVVINDGGPCLEKFLLDNFPSHFNSHDHNGPNHKGFNYSVQPNKYIVLIQNNTTIGRSYTANQGLEVSKGKYIGFLDDDDIYYPYHISSLVETIRENSKEQNSQGVAYSNAVCAKQIVCPFDKRRYLTVDLKKEKGEAFSRKKLLTDNFIPSNSVIFTREALGDTRFDENLDVLEDWDFWLNLSKDNDFYYLDEITCEYRVRLDSSNTTGQLDHIWWYSREYMQKKHKDLIYSAKRA